MSEPPHQQRRSKDSASRGGGGGQRGHRQGSPRSKPDGEAEPKRVSPASSGSKGDVTVEVDPGSVPQPETVKPDEPLPPGRYLNRELSWLDFNARVLTIAEDPATPLLERAKFLAIFASNLDEFYMVRVAGLQRRLEMGLPLEGGAGLTPREQLALIAEWIDDGMPD